MKDSKGKLFLVPAPLSETQYDYLLPHEKEMIKDVKHFIVETPRIARWNIKALDLSTKLQELDIKQFDINSNQKEIPLLMEPVFKGEDIAYMSDVGLPAIADPGNQLVYLAHRNKIEVVPLVGASSLMIALMSSGLNGQSFTFHGYLPVEQVKRISALKAIDKLVKTTGYTHLFIETPYRNLRMYQDIIKSCNPDTQLSLAIDLGSKDQSIYTARIGEWKTLPVPKIDKHQAVFLLGS